MAITEVNERLMTTKEVAAFLNVEPMTLYNLRTRGELKAMKIGRSIRFRRSEVEAYLQRSIQGEKEIYVDSIR